MNVLLFLAVMFICTFILGRFLEKIRIPWIFSALILGVILASYNPFAAATSTPSFLFLAELGMYFLIFIIGFELDLSEFKKQTKFVVTSTIYIVLSESLIGAIAIHYIFNLSWLVSLIVASSFSTVGEAVLLPILDEFKLMKTQLGQLILGIGVFDDVFEIFMLVAVSILVGKNSGYSNINIWSNVLILGSLCILVFMSIQLLQKKLHTFKFKDIPSFFLFVLFFIFLFVGIGEYVEGASLGAFLAGIALRNIIPQERLDFIDSEIRTMSYGFFAPIFFLWVGLNIDVIYITEHFALVLLILLITIFAKIGSIFIQRKQLGFKRSILLGVGLSVKLSTSIVLVKILYEQGFIGKDLYSLLIAATALSCLLVPMLLYSLLQLWCSKPKYAKELYA